jgi:hypothetical protein
MDFIERLIGVSPDGGDGSTEWIYVGAFVLIAVAILSRVIAAELTDRRAFLSLPQNEGYLRLRKLRALWCFPSNSARINHAAKLEFSSKDRSSKPGAGHCCSKADLWTAGG